MATCIRAFGLGRMDGICVDGLGALQHKAGVYGTEDIGILKGTAKRLGAVGV